MFCMTVVVIMKRQLNYSDPAETNWSTTGLRQGKSPFWYLDSRASFHGSVLHFEKIHSSLLSWREETRGFVDLSESAGRKHSERNDGSGDSRNMISAFVYFLPTSEPHIYKHRQSGRSEWPHWVRGNCHWPASCCQKLKFRRHDGNFLDWLFHESFETGNEFYCSCDCWTLV